MAQVLLNQLFDSETSTYTYLVADKIGGDAILIDPVFEKMARDLKLIAEMELKLRYVLDTHLHADHVTAAGPIADQTGAQVAMSAASQAQGVDVSLRGQESLQFGDRTLKALATPGHTHSCMSYLIEGCVFTGDALLIRSNGRTDFQEGSAATLYQSITTQLFTLPNETHVYPAHDYNGQTSSTIGLEKKWNTRIAASRTQIEFIKIMADLKLPPPKKLEIAVPRNLRCGRA
jgi:glyoxylase-like metal-dependent hydrolase (beta-lactamase superfamily II)